MGTDISWCDETWNPVVGCSKTSPGCDNCYAIGVAHRAMQPAHVGLTVKQEGEAADWTGEVRCLPERLAQPSRWRKPRKVFVNSMSDLFHPDVPDGFIVEVFDVMANAYWHTFQVLTKRPQRMASFCSEYFRSGIPNVWLGASIETDRYAFRAVHVRATPAAVRFLSLEPLLGPLPSLDLTGIDWVIVGGESGRGARPMHPDWVREIRDRCRDAGVPFHFKQWGEWMSYTHSCQVHADRLTEWHRETVIDIDGRTLGIDDPCEFELEPSLMLRLGKKANGRTLDGRTWDEWPT